MWLLYCIIDVKIVFVALIIGNSSAQWTSWSEWGPCKGKCGSQLQHRTRQCNTKPCTGPAQITRACNGAPCPNYAPSDNCPNPLLDVIFLVDVSASISGQNFDKIRDFLSEFIRELDIGEDKKRISLVTYSDYVSVQFYLSDFKEKDHYDWLVKSIYKPVIGLTDTGKALRYVAKNVLVPYKGMRNQTGARKILLVMTDGQSTHPEQTKSAAFDLGMGFKGLDIFVLASNVTQKKHIQELRDIAVQKRNVFNFKSYDEMLNSVSTIRGKICSKDIQNIVYR